MKISFPFEYIRTNEFGKVQRPYVIIFVFKKDAGIYLQRVMVVDSGADFTIFPKKDAYLFGIDLDKETVKNKTFGVGGEETVFLYKRLPIKIGTQELIESLRPWKGGDS